MHAIKSDLKTGIIEAQFIGFWDRADVTAFARDIHAHAERISAAGKRHMLLVDYSQARIQAQETVAALADSVRKARHRARRIAAFTTSGMAKLQAGRIAAAREDIATFDDRDSALDWLMEAQEPRRTPMLAAARYVAH